MLVVPNKQVSSRSRMKDSLLVLGLLTGIYAVMMPDRHLMLHHYMQLMTMKTHLLQDFLASVGASATFLNVALHYVIAYGLFISNKQTKLSGLQLGAVGIFIGHSFFGTHVLNILPILLGVFLYAKFTRHTFSRFTTMSLFATAVSPIVSHIATSSELGSLRFVLAIGVGVTIGFISVPLAEHFLKFHQGFSLYNYGFTTGMIAMFTVVLLAYTPLKVPNVNVVSHQYHMELLGYIGLHLCVLFFVSIRKQEYIKDQFLTLLSHSGRVPDDFVSRFGISTTFMNMFLTGLVYTVAMLLLGVTFNGPIIGALFTVIGFSAFGKHVFNCLPVSAGVLLAAFLFGKELSQVSVIVPFLFATGLAPIAGFYGFFAGLVAGFLHFNLTSAVIVLHQGLSLYNNGFTAGFVAAFLVPIIEIFVKEHPHKH